MFTQKRSPAIEQEGLALQEMMRAKTSERDALQADLRQREKGLETARHQVLRLLGEGSNCAINSRRSMNFSAAVERDTARAEERRTARRAIWLAWKK